MSAQGGGREEERERMRLFLSHWRGVGAGPRESGAWSVIMQHERKCQPLLSTKTTNRQCRSEQ